MPQYQPVFELSSLDGNNGFRIDGEAQSDESGFSVASAGDVNGDGYADLIIGAPFADPNGDLSGASYVVFGKASGFGTSLNLSSLDGANGFQINGEIAGDFSGVSVASAGDVNGDGYADLIVGASRADPNGNMSGASYVVFGKASGFAATLDLFALDGHNGFQISGEAPDDGTNSSVGQAGDLNGDGFADLVIGAPYADPNGNKSGATYIVFGRASGFGTVDLSTLDGTNGFRINGGAAGDGSGNSVSSAGDFNGDGFADLIVGAYKADPNGGYSGASYVVFGKASSFGATLELAALDGHNGFQISGEAQGDGSGRSVASAGDINGDGFADVIVGAVGADPNGDGSGASYVVFGKHSGFSATFALGGLDGNNGFQINGEAANDSSGISVASAGDFNGDGFADLIVGARGAAPHGIESGASYVIFGKASGFSATLELSTLDGTNGFQINGERARADTGFSVASAGDINGDGLDDLIIGAPGADSSNAYGAGVSYVIYGVLPTESVNRTGTNIANTIHGGDSNDVLTGLKGDDVLFGHDGIDTIYGGNDSDTLYGGDSRDMLFGGSGIDTLYGGEGDDTIDTGSGIDIVYGGDGSDRILSGKDFAAGEVVYGGVGFTDTVVVDGLANGFMLTAGQLHDVERIELTAGQGYKLSVNDSFLAPGVVFGIDGSHLGAHDKLVFNGRGEHDGYLSAVGGAGKDNLTLGNGGGFLVTSLGHDTLKGGSGFDQFGLIVATTTGKGFDTIVDFDSVGTPGISSDQFSVAGLVTGVDSAIAGGTLSKRHFDTDLASVADSAHLAAGHAVAFTPDDGTYDGRIFLVIDQNGVAGYQSGSDIVVELKGSVDLGSLDTGDFYTFF